jgi:hypothetical protein
MRIPTDIENDFPTGKQAATLTVVSASRLREALRR